MRMHVPSSPISTSKIMDYSPLHNTMSEFYTIASRSEHATTRNKHALPSGTSPNAPIIIFIIQVLQYNMVIQSLTWIHNGYQAYPYAYDTHTIIKKYEIDCNMRSHWWNISIHLVYCKDWHQYYFILSLTTQYTCMTHFSKFIQTYSAWIMHLCIT